MSINVGLIIFYLIRGFLFFILLAILYRFIKECDFESLPIICSVFFIVACFFLFNKETSLPAVIVLGITFLINAVIALNVSRKAQWAITMILVFFSIVGWLMLLVSLGRAFKEIVPTGLAFCLVAPLLLFLWLFIMDFVLWGCDTDFDKLRSNNEE